MAAITTNKQLDRIEKAIIGNGQEGLIARTARIEEGLKTAAGLAADAKTHAELAAVKAQEVSTRATELINKLTINITKMENTLVTHVGTDHLSVMMKKKSFWALVIIGYITLHIIATYVPNLWDLIVTLLGIPKLAIPVR